MKTRTKHSFLLPALIASLGLLLAHRAAAQTFTTLHTFTALSGTSPYLNIITNSEGAQPYAGLILSGNTLYGTAQYGGTNANGTVFAVNTDGTGFTNLYTFSAECSSCAGRPNNDGASPWAGLVLSGSTLYGTAESGGTNGTGTVFAINTNGTGFTTLHAFSAVCYSCEVEPNSDGSGPWGGLILSGNTLYGTASSGGTNGWGTVFAVNTNGTGFTNLHSFAACSGYYPNVTNSDGASPWAGLVLSGSTLYGTTSLGGTNGTGTLFAINTNGTGFTTLHTFAANSGSSIYIITNTDGASPEAGLVVSGSTLYGTAETGGTNGTGTVFAINTNGTGFTTLHIFTAFSGSDYTNSDGALPDAGLTLSGNTLYGTTVRGGTNGWGTVFAVNTNGTGFTNLHSFAACSGYYPNVTNSDGAAPMAGLVLSGSTLYGTTSLGGTNGTGTVFSLSLGAVAVSRPQLSITPSGANVILTWPTTAAGFILQSTTNLVTPSCWITNFPPPVAVNGQNTVTNSISGTQKYYRLSQ